MALTVQLLESPCVTWNTALPHMMKSFTGPAFSLKTLKVKFIIFGYLTRSQEKWLVSMCTSRSLGTMSVVTYIERKRHRLQLLGCREVEYSDIDFGRQRVGVGYSFKGYYRITEFTRITLLLNEILEDEVSLVFVFHLDSCSKNIIKDLRHVTDSEKIKLEEPPAHICTFCLESLSMDIEKLFDDKEHSDVVLKCGDRSFFVNRKILSVRSEVFAAMFSNEMSKKNTGLVNITDIEPSLLELLLRYIYCGRLDDLSMDSVFDLYRAADKCAVASMKRKCASFLVDNLSEENVCQVLRLADAFGDRELLALAMNFAVNSNGFLKSDEWNDFARDHTALAVDVYKKFIMK